MILNNISKKELVSVLTAMVEKVKDSDVLDGRTLEDKAETRNGDVVKVYFTLEEPNKTESKPQPYSNAVKAEIARQDRQIKQIQDKFDDVVEFLGDDFKDHIKTKVPMPFYHNGMSYDLAKE